MTSVPEIEHARIVSVAKGIFQLERRTPASQLRYCSDKLAAASADPGSARPTIMAVAILLSQLANTLEAQEAS